MHRSNILVELVLVTILIIRFCMYLRWESTYVTLKTIPHHTILLTPFPTLESVGHISLHDSPLSMKAEDDMDNQSAYVFVILNAFREHNGLKPLVPDASTCTLASKRAAEIVTNFSHSGFIDRITSHQLPYKNYHLIVENLALNSDYRQVLSAWIQSPEHRANLLQNLSYGCIADSGNFYAFEGLE